MKKKKGKNKILNERLNVLNMDMENNYKDAAQLDFDRVKQTFSELKAYGKLSKNEETYYAELIAEYEKKLAHFRHAEGPGTGLFQG